MSASRRCVHGTQSRAAASSGRYTPRMGFLDTSAFRRFGADKMQKVNLFETQQMFSDVYCLEPGQAQKVHAHAGNECLG